MRDGLEELSPRVYRYAVKLTGDAERACDLTQEAMLRAWRSRGRLRDPRARRVWLFRIVSNLWTDQLRRRPLQEDVDSAAVEEHTDRFSPSPDQAAQRREQLDRAMRAMDALPVRQRQVLHLHTCESLSVSEIAAVLEISANAVKASLSLARKQMRTQLKDIVEDISSRAERTV